MHAGNLQLWTSFPFNFSELRNTENEQMIDNCVIHKNWANLNKAPIQWCHPDLSSCGVILICQHKTTYMKTR